MSQITATTEARSGSRKDRQRQTYGNYRPNTQMQHPDSYSPRSPCDTKQILGEGKMIYDTTAETNMSHFHGASNPRKPGPITVVDMALPSSNPLLENRDTNPVLSVVNYHDNSNERHKLVSESIESMERQGRTYKYGSRQTSDSSTIAISDSWKHEPNWTDSSAPSTTRLNVNPTGKSVSYRPSDSRSSPAQSQTIPLMPSIKTSASVSSVDQISTWLGDNLDENLEHFKRDCKNIDRNRTIVSRPRSWGLHSSLAKEGRFDDASEASAPKEYANSASLRPLTPVDVGNWNSVGQWVEQIMPVPPPPDNRSSPIGSHVSDASSILRPSSVIRRSDAVTLFYSDDEHSVSSLSPSLATITLNHATNDSPKMEPTSEETYGTLASRSSTIQPHKQDRPNTLHKEISDPQYPLNPQTTRTSQTSRSHHHGSDSLPTRRRWEERGPGSAGQWWKKDPHPMYSPLFASRRLLVKTPFPIRVDQHKSLMYDHFSKYGTLRCVIPYDSDGDQSEQAVVVFREEASVHKVLKDSKREQCIYRSLSHSGPVHFELEIKELPAESQLRTVWIKVTGPRFDSRSRSASPCQGGPKDRNIVGSTDSIQFDTSPLPPTVSIWAVPRILKHRKGLVYGARLILPDVQEENFTRRIKFETGKEPIRLHEFDLGRRIPEKDFMPQMVDFFGEIYDIIPPVSRAQGWLVTTSGQVDARTLMDQMASIPGISVRWANEGDGIFSGPPQSPQSVLSDNNNPLCAVACPEMQDLTGIKSITNELKDSLLDPNDVHRQLYINTSEVVTMTENGTITPPPSPKQLKQPPFSLNRRVPFSPVPAPEYPHLRRQMMYTYKGRPLREELTDGEPKYIDDAAVFVGRLVKGHETHFSILKRFERYGKITCVEYNPTAAQSAYATARVLFQDTGAAARAIQWENSMISFGSAIKVEPRRVLPMDVQTREMYIDIQGRAISPSMASQYTPPTPRAPSPPAAYIPPLHLPVANPPLPPPWFPVPPPGTMSLPAFSSGPYSGWYQPQSYMQFPPPQLMSVNNGNSPSHLNEIQSNSASLVPILWQFGIGFCPAPKPPPVPVPHGTTQNMTSESMQQSTVPVQSDAVPMATSPLNTSNSQPEGGRNESPSSNPRVVGHKFEEGMFKPIYDPDEMKRWREANGIPDAPPKSETLPLLPLSTGGHDPIPASSALHGRLSKIPPMTGNVISNTSYNDDSPPVNHLVPLPLPFPSAEGARKQEFSKTTRHRRDNASGDDMARFRQAALTAVLEQDNVQSATAEGVNDEADW